MQRGTARRLSGTHLVGLAGNRKTAEIRKVGLIGSTDLFALSNFSGLKKEILLQEADIIGKALAEVSCEMHVSCEGGMIGESAKAYKLHSGPNLVVFFPGKGEPWSNNPGKSFVTQGDEIRQVENWFACDYSVVTRPDIVVCAGLDPKVLSQLSYVQRNLRYGLGNVVKIIALRNLLREKKLPIEIMLTIRDAVSYIDCAENLKSALLGLI